jgi:hypothetical protein
MFRPASLALLLLTAQLLGCASAPDAPTQAMSAGQLHALVFGAQQPKPLGELDGREIRVRGDVDLRYRGQQRLVVNGANAHGDCVQLIVPTAINQHFTARRFRGRIEGSLIVLPSPADGELYIHYEVDGVHVYPACDGHLMVFLKVAKLTRD